MTSVPYPTFANVPPVVGSTAEALSAVGKCRIYPLTSKSDEGATEYRAIVAKCVDQSKVDDSKENPDRDANKKLKKKLMKEGVAMAKSFLENNLGVDVSVVDVEILVGNDEILSSSGLIASCFLDAGCDAIVVDGASLEALDATKLPKERLVAHFDGSPSSEAVESACELASTISFLLKEFGSADDVLTLMQGDQEKIGDKYQSVVQIDANSINAEVIGQISKGCKGKGTITLIDPSATQLGMGYAACMRTDRDDGLFTTVVCTRSNEALGLVYSSKVRWSHAV